MKILVFGNPIEKIDSNALKVAEELKDNLKGVEFVFFDTAEDLEKEGKEIAILDCVVGLKKPRLVEIEELEIPKNPLSLHGFDLAWNLLLLKKLGILKKAHIIGVPAKGDYKKHIKEIEKIIKNLKKEDFL